MTVEFGELTEALQRYCFRSLRLDGRELGGSGEEHVSVHNELPEHLVAAQVDEEVLIVDMNLTRGDLLPRSGAEDVAVLVAHLLGTGMRHPVGRHYAVAVE